MTQRALTVTRRYEAFLSYSHAADSRLARDLRSALHQFAKPWYRLRALRIFLDQASLSANPALWPSILEALAGSEHFVLLASPEAAQSPWVKREVAWWLSNRSPNQMAILLTAGELAWDPVQDDFDWSVTTAVPDSLRGRLTAEPLYVDLRWSRDAPDLSLRQPRFRGAVLDISAFLHNRAKDEMDGDDIREYRRTRRLAWAAVTALAVLAVTASVAAFLAFRQSTIAEAERRLAVSRQLAAQADLAEAQNPASLPLNLLLAIRALEEAPTLEAQRVLRNGLRLFSRPIGRIELPLGADTRAVQVSPDFAHVAAVLESWPRRSTDHAVRVWETATTREVALLPHVDTVHALSYSPDAELLATGSRDGIARIWKMSTAQEIAQLRHEAAVNVLAFSPDGAYLATGTDVDVRLWNASGSEMWRLPYQKRVRAVAFAPHGRWLATLSGDATVRVLVVPSDREIMRIDLDHTVSSMVFSPDGLRLATAVRKVIRHFGESEESTVQVWDVESAREARRIVQAQDVSALAFSPDGKRIATASYDHTARIWDVGTGRELVRMTHASIVADVVFTPDGHYLATASWDALARVWDASSGREVARMVHDFRRDHIVIDQKARYFFTYGSGTLWVWHAFAGDQVMAMEHGDAVFDVAYSQDGRYLATASANGVARIWSAVTGNQIAQVEYPYTEIIAGATDELYPSGIAAIDLSSDGHYLATASGRWDAGDRTAHVWDASNGREITPLRHDQFVLAVAFSPDNRLLASGSTDGARIWSVPDGREILRLDTGHYVWDVDFSANGQYVAMAGRLMHASIREVSGGREVARVEHEGFVNSLDFSLDGHYLATGGQDAIARIWEVGSWREVRRLPHDAIVWDVEFSVDGRYLATASSNRQGAPGVVRVWEVSSGQELAVVNREDGANAVAFSPDGRRLATAAWASVARLWLVWPEDLIAEACSRLSVIPRSDKSKRFFASDADRRTCEGLPSIGSP